MYEIIAVPDEAPVQYEQMGTKYKFWYVNDDVRVLFKQGRPGTGENWSEKVCCEICELLGLPHANYELAEWKGMRGVISPSIVAEGFRLVHGNELLAGVSGYDAEKRYRVKGHTVRLVVAVIARSNVNFPIGYNAPSVFTSAADIFAGYLMLDALVGNQDRHHENWALVTGPDRCVYLAPTFDHAASLGRNESDEAREDRLTTKDKGRSVEVYVERARSALYKTPGSARPLSTLDAFIEVARFRQVAAKYWVSKLGGLSFIDIETILNNIPSSEMSDQARAFASKMLKLNIERILNCGV